MSGERWWQIPGSILLARDALVDKFNERLEAAEQVVMTWLARERELQAKLADEVARGDELERQLRLVRWQGADDQAATTALRQRLQRLQEDYDAEVRLVAELRAELAAVVSRRREAENTVRLIRSDQTELGSFFASMRDLLDLNFVRAEAERREKERLMGECATLRSQVKELERTLAMYQAQH